PVRLTGRGRAFEIDALNPRGEVLLAAMADLVAAIPGVVVVERTPGLLRGTVPAADRSFPEEQRSKQNSIFSVIRALLAGFALPGESYLGLYGAFGYDLVFKFENIEQQIPRPD